MKYYYDRYWGAFFKRSVEAGTGPATLDNSVKPADLELIGLTTYTPRIFKTKVHFQREHTPSLDHLLILGVVLSVGGSNLHQQTVCLDGVRL